MISKMQFISLMDELKKLNSQNLNDSNIIISQNSIVFLLTDSLNDSQTLKHWMFDCNFGTISDEIKNPGQLYDYLIEHKKDFIKGTSRKKITEEQIYEYIKKKQFSKEYDGSVITVAEIMNEFNTTKYEATKMLHILKNKGIIRPSVSHYDPVTGKTLKRGDNISLIKRGWLLI